MKKLQVIILLVLAVLLAGGCTPRPPAPQSEVEAGAGEKLVGVWLGELNVLDRTMEVGFRFENQGGELKGWLDLPGLGVSGKPLSNLQVSADHIRFEYESNLPVSIFEAPGVEGDTLSGEYRQLGYKGTFRVQRSEAGQPAVPTPQAPKPYREEALQAQIGDVRISGTLSLPVGPGPHPAVILVSGSGLQDRNNSDPSIPDYKPFLWLADHLTPLGIAVMRYDDRGLGESVGGDLGADTTYDYSTDAEAVFDALRQHPEINPAQIGILGHSEGGHIAALVASRRPETAFAINLAGTAVSGADILMLQTELVGRAEGLDEAEIARRIENNQKEVDLILAQDWDALEEFLTEAVRGYYMELPPEQRFSGEMLEQAIQETVAFSMKNNKGFVHYFFSAFPAQDWAKVQAPVLALFGELDRQVDPDQNAPVLEEALAHHPDATVLVVPKANHLFQEAVTGGGDEYSRLPPKFVEGLLELISEWILERVDIQPAG